MIEMLMINECDTQILMRYVCLVILPPLDIDFSLVLWPEHVIIVILRRYSTVLYT
jgi:hypothetical protein